MFRRTKSGAGDMRSPSSTATARRRARQARGALAVRSFSGDVADQQAKSAGSQRCQYLLVELPQIEERSQGEEEGGEAGGARQDRVADLLGRLLSSRSLRPARGRSRPCTRATDVGLRKRQRHANFPSQDDVEAAAASVSSMGAADRRNVAAWREAASQSWTAARIAPRRIGGSPDRWWPVMRRTTRSPRAIARSSSRSIERHAHQASFREDRRSGLVPRCHLPAGGPSCRRALRPAFVALAAARQPPDEKAPP